jgi:hypothetical protein
MQFLIVSGTAPLTRAAGCITFLTAASRVLTDCRHGVCCSWHLTLKTVLNIQQCCLASKCCEVLMASYDAFCS